MHSHIHIIPNMGTQRSVVVVCDAGACGCAHRVSGHECSTLGGG